MFNVSRFRRWFLWVHSETLEANTADFCLAIQEKTPHFKIKSAVIMGRQQKPQRQQPQTIKAQVTEAPRDESPRRRKPQTIEAPGDNSPKRRKPQETKAPDDKSPRLSYFSQNHKNIAGKILTWFRNINQYLKRTTALEVRIASRAKRAINL